MYMDGDILRVYAITHTHTHKTRTHTHSCICEYDKCDCGWQMSLGQTLLAIYRALSRNRRHSTWLENRQFQPLYSVLHSTVYVPSKPSNTNGKFATTMVYNAMAAGDDDDDDDMHLFARHDASHKLANSPVAQCSAYRDLE